MEDSKFREFLRTAFGIAAKALKPGGSFYIFHADSEGYNFRGACFDVGLRVRQCLVWKKNSLVLGRQGVLPSGKGLCLWFNHFRLYKFGIEHLREFFSTTLV